VPYENMKVAVSLTGLLGLALIAGCAHESAANHMAGARPATTTVSVAGHEADPMPADGSPRETEPAIVETASSPETAEPIRSEPALLSNSPLASPSAGQRPPADRTPRRPGDAEKITFDDLNLGMVADVVYRDFMLSDRVKELTDKRISLVGYMHAGQSSQRGIKDFILLKNTQCKFGPGGQADHLANVILREGSSTKFSPSPVKVEGTLKVQPFNGPDGNTWSIYRLEDAQIR
jgi:hypothetical protein